MKGRTYRYFDDALFPFGYGLSYTTFETENGELALSDEGNGTLTVDVKNTGKRDGTEIAQLYIRQPGDKEGPLKSLRGFQRVSVKSGQSVKATIALTRKSFEFWDAETNTMRVKPGEYEVLYGTSSRAADLKSIKVSIK